MKLPEEGVLLKIFIGEADAFDGKPLYESIVLKAKELGLAGATVFRGMMGFGACSRLHTFKVMRLSADLPILIEIVDTHEKIETIIPFLDEHVKEGLITMHPLKVIKYRYNKK